MQQKSQDRKNVTISGKKIKMTTKDKSAIANARTHVT